MKKIGDDLISRKAVLDLIDKLGYINVSNHDDFRANCRMDKIRQEVSELPTSFDKEKVIEELIFEDSRWHESGVEFKDENEKGVAAGFRLATHIVERGGIE